MGDTTNGHDNACLQQTVDCHHPSVYKLVEHFKQEQDHVELLVARYQSGAVVTDAPKAKYVRVTKRLQTIVPTYGTIPKLDYLRAIAHNVELGL